MAIGEGSLGLEMGASMDSWNSQVAERRNDGVRLTSIGVYRCWLVEGCVS
jgi:hypothetical protein